MDRQVKLEVLHKLYSKTDKDTDKKQAFKDKERLKKMCRSGKRWGDGKR